MRLTDRIDPSRRGADSMTVVTSCEDSDVWSVSVRREAEWRGKIRTSRWPMYLRGAAGHHV